MTTTPYELLVRFKPDGSVAGASVRTITNANGRDYESDPVPLADATDPVFVEFAKQFSAAVVSERDSLATQVTTLASERDAALSARDAAFAQVEDLQSQLDALQNPPFNARHIAPFNFLGRFTPEETYGLITSTDPVIVVAIAKLQTIITYVDLDLPETQQLVAYLVAIEHITQERATTILADVEQ